MPRYNNIPIIKSPDGKRMYRTVRYPEIPRSSTDIYVYTTMNGIGSLIQALLVG